MAAAFTITMGDFKGRGKIYAKSDDVIISVITNQLTKSGRIIFTLVFLGVLGFGAIAAFPSLKGGTFAVLLAVLSLFAVVLLVIVGFWKSLAFQKRVFSLRNDVQSLSATRDQETSLASVAVKAALMDAAKNTRNDGQYGKARNYDQMNSQISSKRDVFYVAVNLVDGTSFELKTNAKGYSLLNRGSNL